MRHVFRQIPVDVEEMRDHTGADRQPFHLAQLESKRVGNVLLLGLRLAHVKLPCLAVVVSEGLGADAQFGPLLGSGVGVKALLERFARTAGPVVPGIGLVVDPACRIDHGHVPVLLKMMHGALGRVDRNAGEVWTPETFELRIEVREVAPLQEGIIRKVDSRHDIQRAEGDLLSLSEEIVDTAIEHEAPDTPNGDLLLRDNLGRIEHIEDEVRRERLIEEL